MICKKNQIKRKGSFHQKTSFDKKHALFVAKNDFDLDKTKLPFPKIIPRNDLTYT